MRTIRFVTGIVLVVALSSFLTPHSYAGFEGYWLQKTVTESDLHMAGKQSEKTEQKVFFRPGMMKMVDLSTGEMTILRMDKELMWQVDAEDSTYTEVTFAEMEKASAEGKEQWAKARAEMMEEMKDMPPEQRKLVEKMMESKMSTLMGAEEAVELSLKRTGNKENVGGYDCEYIVITANDDPFVEMWVTDTFDLGGELFNFYEKMSLFQYEPTKELLGFKGFPMKTVFNMEMGMGTVQNVTTVSKVMKTSLKESEFDLPKGLVKQKRKVLKPE